MSLALWLGLSWGAAQAAAAPARAPAPPPESVAQVADWVIASGDNRGLAFAIIDKVTAKVFVYRADGHPRGRAAVLVGSARGDQSTPGVGDRELSDIRPEDRTTPAGRFLAGYGPAWGGKKVLWVDYATAISLHPVVTANRKEQRVRRLKSATAKDNRITYGCINVSAAFYEGVVRPAFRGKGGVVYILPETTPLDEVFPGLRTQAARADGPGADPAPEVADASH